MMEDGSIRETADQVHMPFFTTALKRDLRSISRKAISTASVLLEKPCALMTRSSKSSSMCIVIFMPY